MNILKKIIENDPSSTAYISDDEVITYGQLKKQFLTFYHFLQQKKIDNTHHVMLVLEDTYKFPAMVMACFAKGVKFYVPSPTFSVANLQALVAKTQTAHVFHNQDNTKVKNLKDVQVHDIREIGEADNSHYDTYAFRENETAMYLNTTGSTGEPKLIPHTMANIMNYAKYFSRALGIQKPTKLYCIPKICFGHGFGISMLVNLYTGSQAIIYSDSPTPQKIEKVFGLYQPRYLFMVPVIANMLVKKKRKIDFSMLEMAVCSSDFLPDVLQKKFFELYGKTLLNMIGQSECFSYYTIAKDTDYAHGSIGKPLPEVEIKILNGAEVCGTGEIGDLYVRTPYNAVEYLGEDIKTKDTFNDGWVKTRDRASLGADGSLFYKGRIDNLIKIKSLFLNPLEIESAFLAIDGIDDVLIETFNDEHGIPNLQAKVVVSKKIDSMGIKQAVGGSLDSHKIPKKIIFVDNILRTWNGKKIRQIKGEK
jgi:benzoate-CoA ligase